MTDLERLAFAEADKAYGAAEGPYDAFILRLKKQAFVDGFLAARGGKVEYNGKEYYGN